MHPSLTISLLATALIAAAFAIVLPERRNPATHPAFAPAVQAQSELGEARRFLSGTTYRARPALPYITGIPRSVFVDCLAVTGNDPVDNDMDGLADNLDIRRLPWPPPTASELISPGVLDPAVIAAYEKRFCDGPR